jgi:transposase
MEEKHMSVFVGIDIAAKSFDMVSREQGKNAKPTSFAQSGEGHAKAIKALKALNPRHIVMEATGIYYLDLAVALANAGLPVSVINPKSYHHFAQLKLAGSKTDGIDSALLAEYGERMSPPLWTPPDTSRLALRDVARQLNRLTGARTQAKNRLHALQAKGMTLPLLIEDEQEGIALLERRIERLQQAALGLLAESEELSAQLKAVCAAKGIATVSAIALLGELCVLPAHLKAPQVSRYAGLDVRLSQSGTSVNRPARLSKAGNAYLRAALYMPAMCAVRHDPRTKAFYDSLIARGKKKIQALCAVMRKYLTGLWACIQHNMPFDSAKLFSDRYPLQS